jgi:hypothetical protein
MFLGYFLHIFGLSGEAPSSSTIIDRRRVDSSSRRARVPITTTTVSNHVQGG